MPPKRVRKPRKARKPKPIEEEDFSDSNSEIMLDSEKSDEFDNIKDEFDQDGGESENEPDSEEQPESIDELEEDEELDEEDDLNDDLEIDDEDKGFADKEACMYNVLDDQSDDDDDATIEEDLEDEDLGGRVPDDERITKPILYQFERVRLLGDRAQQIKRGAVPKIKNSAHLNAKEIARLELEYKVMPLIIKRPLPNGLYEIWKLNELTYLI